MKRIKSPCITVAIALASISTLPAVAQEAPSAGLIYQQSQDKKVTPLQPSVELDFKSVPAVESEAGGTKVRVKKITLQGHSVFASDALLLQFGDYQEQEYDLAGLRYIADSISQYYHEHGYPFVRTVLPVQDLASGELHIEVIEGRYGRVAASGESELASAAQPYLHRLRQGQVIDSKSLERSMLILGDQPGIAVIPVIRPGEQSGTGNLDVQVRQDQRVAATVSADNHGSRFSGEYRGRADLQINQALLFGDQLSVSTLYTNEDTWLGGLDYSLPLMANGLRGFVGYSHTDYTLGKGFEGYTGTAKVSSIGASYPLLRSQKSNVRLQFNYQYKDLDDNVDFASYSKATRSESIPLTLLFDHRDTWLGGGVSWGALTATPGKIKSNQDSLKKSNNDFFKVNFDVSRLQYVASDLSLYGRVSGQWSDRKYLDGSESFYLGGPSGVRAYSVGEGSDSRGWLAQLELRYSIGQGLSPYLLVDGGRTWNGGVDDGDDRAVSGAGFGVRYSYAGWNADFVSAWAVSGGDSQSDSKQRKPRVWFNLGYSF